MLLPLLLHLSYIVLSCGLHKRKNIVWWRFDSVWLLNLRSSSLTVVVTIWTVILLVPWEAGSLQSYGGDKRGALFDKRPELQIVCSIVSLWKCLVHLGRWIKGIKSELEAGQDYCETIVQNESLLIRQHNDDSNSTISESQQHLCTSFLLLLLFPPRALSLTVPPCLTFSVSSISSDGISSDIWLAWHI